APLERLTLKALEKDPEDRFRTASAMRAELKAIPERPPPPPIPRWLKQVAAVLLLAVAAIALWKIIRHPPAQVYMAVLPFEDMNGVQDATYFARGVTQELIDRLGEIRPDRLGIRPLAK